MKGQEDKSSTIGTGIMQRQTWFVLNLLLAGGGAYSSAALRQTATNIYFPKTDGVTFEQANTSQIIGEYLKCTVVTGCDKIHPLIIVS